MYYWDRPVGPCRTVSGQVMGSRTRARLYRANSATLSRVMDYCKVESWLSLQSGICDGLAISNETLSNKTGLSERTLKRRLATLLKTGRYWSKRHAYPMSGGAWSVTRIIYKKDQ